MSLEYISDLPKRVYKYRIWNDKYQKTILTERIVYMASPKSFEDKKDCKLLKRYDLMTERDIYDKYLEMSKQDNPNWMIQQHRAFARDWTRKSPLKDKKYIQQMQERYFNDFDKRFGVLSLTANCSNLEMWNKYSNEGRGFCVGFDPKILFNYLGGGGPVQYYDRLPDILHNDNYDTEYYKQIFSKEKKWKFEEEYRTHKFYPRHATISDRQIAVPQDAFKEIILGWNMDNITKEEIRQVCQNQSLNVEFKVSLNENGNIEIKTCN